MSVVHTIPKPDFINREEIDIYYQGMYNGVAMYAFWKDETQYVGSCGMTLEAAANEILNAKARAHEDFNKQL